MLIARATILMRGFCNTRSDFHMEKTAKLFWNVHILLWVKFYDYI